VAQRQEITPPVCIQLLEAQLVLVLELNQQVNSRFFTELQLLLEYLLKLQSFLQQRQERQPQPEAPQQEILQMVYILLHVQQVELVSLDKQQLSIQTQRQE
jgi:hypothetical protein